jgi:hypothetical protein
MEMAQVKPQVGGQQIAEKEWLLALQRELFEVEQAGLGAHLDAGNAPMDEESVEAEAKPVGNGTKGRGKAK